MHHELSAKGLKCTELGSRPAGSAENTKLLDLTGREAGEREIEGEKETEN